MEWHGHPLDLTAEICENKAAVAFSVPIALDWPACHADEAHQIICIISCFNRAALCIAKHKSMW